MMDAIGSTSAVMTCASRGTWQMLEVLMPYVANSSDLDNKSLVGTNNAAVHIAAENSGDGDHKLGVLLDAGANIERRNYWGYTPLLHAIVRVQLLKTVQVLLDRGADTEARTATGYTALHEAGVHDQVDSARILLKHGADKDAKTSGGHGVLTFGSNDFKEQLKRHTVS